MRFFTLPVLLFAVLAARPQGQVFRGSADNVPVFVTVSDKSGRLVTGLTRDQFEVRDNGKPQPITVFDNSPVPIRVIVLVDVSGSMYRNLPLLQAACQQLVARLGPDDLARLGTFGEQMTLGSRFTRDLNELLASVPRDIRPETRTALWRSVDEAIGAFGSEDGRRVILVMSDGKDNPGFSFKQKQVFEPDVADHAQRDDLMIYGIGLQSRGAPGTGMGARGDLRAAIVSNFPDPALGTLALETGGGYFELRPRDDLAATFARVMDELRQQYLIGFAPPTRDGKVHKIEVKLKNGEFKARARKNYRAGVVPH